MRLKKAAVLCGVFVCALAAAAEAATVHLKDGRKIQGTVVSATARDVTLHIPDGGTRQIDADQILRIDYAAEASASMGPAVPATLDYREETPAHELSLKLGLALPLDRLNFSSLGGGRTSNGSVGPSIGLDYMAATSQRLKAGLGFEYLRRSPTESTSGVPLGVTDVSGDTLLFLGAAKYLLRPGREVRPYARVGLGAHRTTTVVDAAPEEGFVWADTQTFERRRLVDDSAWGVAAAAGLGVEFAYAQPSFFGIELGWTGLAGAAHEPTPAGRSLGLAGGSSMLNILTIGARVGWRF